MVIVNSSLNHGLQPQYAIRSNRINVAKTTYKCNESCFFIVIVYEIILFDFSRRFFSLSLILRLCESSNFEIFHRAHLHVQFTRGKVFIHFMIECIETHSSSNDNSLRQKLHIVNWSWKIGALAKVCVEHSLKSHTVLQWQYVLFHFASRFQSVYGILVSMIYF